MFIEQQPQSAESDFIIVSAPNQAGKKFISLLRECGLRYYAITNNHHGKRKLEAKGVNNIIVVDTEDDRTWSAPDIGIGKVYLFELSFNLCCRYIRMCRSWNPDSIHVVSKRDTNKVTYRGLGADHCTFISNNEVSFLLP